MPFDCHTITLLVEKDSIGADPSFNHPCCFRLKMAMFFSLTRIRPRYVVSRRSLSSPSNKRVETTYNDAGTIAHVQLNRPDKMNALDLAMFHAIRDAAVALQQDCQKQQHHRLRAVIVSGKGRAFCTGLDVGSMMNTRVRQTSRELLAKPNDASSNLAQDVAYQWRQLPVPVICALHGMCFGGGLQIALGADMRYASPDCRLAIMEAKVSVVNEIDYRGYATAHLIIIMCAQWGLIPDMTATVTLRELVRLDIAKELTMTGRILSAQEALEYGLVTRVVDDPLQEAQNMAELIVQQSPDAVAWTKKLYQSTWVAATERECLKLETDAQTKLMASWNQMVKAASNFGWSLPYRKRTAPSEDDGAK
jgi:enoyl-CoA hydratase/carnithine racemase